MGHFNDSDVWYDVSLFYESYRGIECLGDLCLHLDRSLKYIPDGPRLTLYVGLRWGLQAGHSLTWPLVRVDTPPPPPSPTPTHTMAGMIATWLWDWSRGKWLSGMDKSGGLLHNLVRRSRTVLCISLRHGFPPVIRQSGCTDRMNP